MGWALDNLDSSRRREIAEGCFRVEKVYGTKLHGFCPVHGDQKSASAFYNWEQDSGGCQSCGEDWDLVGFWCMANGYDKHDIKAFREEFDSDYTGGARSQRKQQPQSRKSPPPPAPEVYVDPADLALLPPLPEETVLVLKEKRGWARAAIEELDLREFTDAKGKKRIAMPVSVNDGQLGNIRLYMPGAGEFKIISWFDQKCKGCGGAWHDVCVKCGGPVKYRGKKRSCVDEFCAGAPKKVCSSCGGAPNDYGRSRLFPPPSLWRSGTIWLCEGEPDMIAARSAGLNAVTQTAGCGTWPDEFSEHFAGRDVVICYDADQAGYKGAHKAAESLAQHAKSVRIVVWPELMGKTDGQD